MKKIRLQKYLADCGVCSRRKAEEFIRNGRVAIEGKIIKEMGVTVYPDAATVTVDGQLISPENKLYYFLLNKPSGYVTTLSDPQGRPIVTALIKKCPARLFPVGRLDLDTEGALILTNDGDLAQKIQHPSFNTYKTYETLVKGKPSRNKLTQLEKGIQLEGKITAPASVHLLSQKGRNSLIKITIHEGRKRQIKKMFKHIGHPVLQLRRTAYGKLTLGALSVGDYRSLNPSDLKKIFL